MPFWVKGIDIEDYLKLRGKSISPKLGHYTVSIKNPERPGHSRDMTLYTMLYSATRLALLVPYLPFNENRTLADARGILEANLGETAFALYKKNSQRGGALRQFIKERKLNQTDQLLRLDEGCWVVLGVIDVGQLNGTALKNKVKGCYTQIVSKCGGYWDDCKLLGS